MKQNPKHKKEILIRAREGGSQDKATNPGAPVCLCDCSAGKLTSWEGGHRVPGVARWPGVIAAGSVSHALTSTLDYLPTIAALAGVPLPADRHFDGHDITAVLNGTDTVGHDTLFFSVGGEAYEPSTGMGLLSPTALFEAVRLTDIKAMFRVGYGPQCCRGSNGDANTPFNVSCQPHQRLGPVPLWLETPLLFNMTVDIAEAFPLTQGSPEHTQALARVRHVLSDMQHSLDTDMRHKANMTHDLLHKLCCNASNVVCRCNELP
eukprot:m.234400 g.234400  ORF g.234400 m.234400 type:complete len:263 (+) comp18915_c0_seq15:1255-2043(+)